MFYITSFSQRNKIWTFIKIQIWLAFSFINWNLLLLLRNLLFILLLRWWSFKNLAYYFFFKMSDVGPCKYSRSCFYNAIRNKFRDLFLYLIQTKIRFQFLHFYYITKIISPRFSFSLYQKKRYAKHRSSSW